MKEIRRVIFISGAFSAISITAGLFLRGVHVNAGNTLFTLGLMTMLLVFVPLNWFYYTESEAARTSFEKIRFGSGIVCGVLIGLGWALKVCHLPGANLLLLSGGTVLTFAFIPMVIYHFYQKDMSS